MSRTIFRAVMAHCYNVTPTALVGVTCRN